MVIGRPDDPAWITREIEALKRQIRDLSSADRSPRVASGSVDITPSAANTPTAVTVTFPVGRFTGTPRVTATANIPRAQGPELVGVGVTGISASAFGAWLIRTTTTTTGVQWIAVQDG